MLRFCICIGSNCSLVWLYRLACAAYTPSIDSKGEPMQGEPMISLTADRSLRLRAKRRTRIGCESGLVWLTRAGDPRDLFLTRGAFIELAPGPGVIIATALEPAVISVTQRGSRSWSERLTGGVRTLGALRPMRIQWFAMCRPRVQQVHAPSVPITVCDAIRQDPSAVLHAEQPFGARPGAARLLAAGGGPDGAR